MESEGAHPEWNVALEDVVRKEGEQSQALYWLHNHAANWAARRNDLLQIPSICLATVTGFLGATSEIPSYATGVMTLVVGLLNTLNSYYKFSQRSEGHKIIAQMYLKVYKNIEVELSLPAGQRTPADKLLAELRDRLARISETAPSLPRGTITAFKNHFKEPQTSVPIVANGLDVIRVFRDAPTRPNTPRPVVRLEI